ncbi:MAG: thioredoxin, partial [Kiritimatiellaeota bacterium]|nr:thioredoxin [Kiritimatiellota bacterium]
MQTPSKILIVAALAAAVVGAVVLKQGKPTAKASAPAATADAKLPKFLDLGAGKCIPCKMMAPILEDL